MKHSAPNRDPADSDNSLARAENSAFEVVLARSGKTISVPPEQSIVAAVAAHGVFIPVSCEQGSCGTCLTTLLQGEADHRDCYLTETEYQRGDTIIPCVSRAKSPRIVLDL